MSAVTFAVIGDYGIDNSDERAVSNLVKSHNPDFIVTVGDNTYGSQTLDTAIGQYYSDYIGNYNGSYGSGSETNRFFPALGNHDWSDGGGVQAYLDYFTLPESPSGNKRYYDFVQGPVHFFVLDSDVSEPDGNTADSAQADWLEVGLKASVTPWQIVVMHHPPYSSGQHGSTPAVRWPYEAWGADAVLSGHDHNYERLLKDDNGDGVIVPYFVDGIGGAGLRSFSGTVDPDSAMRYGGHYGSMLVKADDTNLTFELWSTANGGSLIDSYSVKPSVEPPVDPPSETHQIILQQGVNGYAGTLDTMVRQGSPDASYGDARIGGFRAVHIDAADQNVRGQESQGLLQFTGLIGTGFGQVPRGAHITSATLTLHDSDAGDGAALHRMLASWDEGATWSSLGNGIQADDTEAVATPDLVTGQHPGSGSRTFDVTASVQAWTDGAKNEGWAFLPLGDNGWDFRSSEGQAPPILTVDYIRDQSILSTTAPGAPAGDWLL